MDISFIGKPHEYDARRVYSLTGADWQERVNFDRLRKDRLARAKEQMELHDLGALVVYDGANIRYLTSSFQGNWKYNIFIRYAVLPQGRRTHPLRNRRLRPRLRKDGPSVDGGADSSGHHLEMV